MPQWCTRQVFRCFKCLERFADRLTGAAGPVFVTLAVGLLSTGLFCFSTSDAASDAIQRGLTWPCNSRGHLAVTAVAMAHNTRMPAHRAQPVRALLLRVYCIAGVRERPSALERYGPSMGEETRRRSSASVDRCTLVGGLACHAGGDVEM